MKNKAFIFKKYIIYIHFNSLNSMLKINHIGLTLYSEHYRSKFSENVLLQLISNSVTFNEKQSSQIGSSCLQKIQMIN